MDVCDRLNECQPATERGQQGSCCNTIRQDRLARVQSHAAARQQGMQMALTGLKALFCVLMCMIGCLQLHASLEVVGTCGSLLYNAHLNGGCDADVEAVCSTLKQLLAGVLGS